MRASRGARAHAHDMEGEMKTKAFWIALGVIAACLFGSAASAQ